MRIRPVLENMTVQMELEADGHDQVALVGAVRAVPNEDASITERQQRRNSVGSPPPEEPQLPGGAGCGCARQIANRKAEHDKGIVC